MLRMKDGYQTGMGCHMPAELERNDEHAELLLLSVLRRSSIPFSPKDHVRCDEVPPCNSRATMTTNGMKAY